MAMRCLDLESFCSTSCTREPFEYLVVPGFVREQARSRINADYPNISERGSFPVGQVTYGPAFQELAACAGRGSCTVSTRIPAA